MATRWNDSSKGRNPRELTAAAPAKPPFRPIDLPLDPGNADFYFTTDGRLIAFPRKAPFARLRTVLLKTAAVAGFVVLAAVCGVVVI